MSMKKIKNNNHTTANPKQDRKEGEKKTAKNPNQPQTLKVLPKHRVVRCSSVNESVSNTM